VNSSNSVYDPKVWALAAALEVIGPHGKTILLNNILKRLAIPADNSSKDARIKRQDLELALENVLGAGSKIIMRLLDMQTDRPSSSQC